MQKKEAGAVYLDARAVPPVEQQKHFRPVVLWHFPR
jgi:hypothetical protein